mgnify:CR=1 FL=1
MKTYERVLEYCKEEGISIYEFEKRCNIGNGTVGRWKNETSQPSIKTLTKIVSTTGTTMPYWFGGYDG